MFSLRIHGLLGGGEGGAEGQNGNSREREMLARTLWLILGNAVLDKRHVYPRLRGTIRPSSFWRGGHGFA